MRYLKKFEGFDDPESSEDDDLNFSGYPVANVSGRKHNYFDSEEDDEFVEPIEEDDNKKGTHLSHCFQGEYKDSCKYGEDETCPARPI